MNSKIKAKIVQRIYERIPLDFECGRPAPDEIERALNTAGYFDILDALQGSAPEVKKVLDEKLGERWWFVGNSAFESASCKLCEQCAGRGETGTDDYGHSDYVTCSTCNGTGTVG